MTLEELNQELSEIQSKVKHWSDLHLDLDREKNQWFLTPAQTDIVRSLISVFSNLGWLVQFQNFKDIHFDDSSTIIRTNSVDGKCGDPVLIRHCDSTKYGSKTYFGILLGDIAVGLSAGIKDDIVSITHSRWNPAILVPELATIWFGYESWWKVIKSQVELVHSITDESIQTQWYVQLLQGMAMQGLGRNCETAEEKVD